MKKEILGKCIKIFNLWQDDDFLIIAKNLNNLPIFENDIYISICSEIDDNLFEKETTQGKTDIIRFYIYTFKEYQNLYLPIGIYLFPERNELPPEFLDDEIEFEDNQIELAEDDIELTEDQIELTEDQIELINDKKKLRTSWFLWDSIFNHLEERCEILSIDYYYLCAEIGFSKSNQFYEKSLYNKFRKIRKFYTLDENLRRIPVKTEAYNLLQKPKLIKKAIISLSEIALFHFYEGISITRGNGDEIAKKHGHKSGEKLFQLYTKYSSRQNRIGKERTLKINLNKLSLIEKVIPRLTSKAAETAKDEMKTLKSAFENED